MSRLEELTSISIAEHRRIREKLISDLCIHLNVRVAAMLLGEDSHGFLRFCEGYAPEVFARRRAGEAPISNSQLGRELQEIIDHMIYVPGEGEANCVRVKTPHVRYLIAVAAHASDADSGKMLSPTQLLKPIYVVCKKLIDGKPMNFFAAGTSDVPALRPVVLSDSTVVFDSAVCQEGVPARYLLKNKQTEQPQCAQQSMKPKGLCIYPSCGEKAWRRGLCWEHYKHDFYTGK